MAEQTLFHHCNGSGNIYTIFIPNSANVIFKKIIIQCIGFIEKDFNKNPKTKEKYIKVYVCSPYMTN